MRILIVCATEEEKRLFNNTNIEFLVTGAGIPNTTLNLTRHLCVNKYDFIINIGICGNFNKEYQIGEVVEVINDEFSEIGYEDNKDLIPFNGKFGIKTTFSVDSRTNLKKVKGITVNTVHGNEESISKIVRRSNPDIETMEGAAFFMVCEKFQISCIQIRAISNRVTKRNIENWNTSLAIQNLHNSVEEIISLI